MKILSQADTFIDYKGAERRFVMAVCSIPEKADVEIHGETKDLDETAMPKEFSFESVKTLSIGVALLRGNDEYDADLGIKIATGKAGALRRHALFATDPGLINTEVVDAVLSQEIEYFKKNPGRYIAGYDKAAENFRYMKHLQDSYESLSPELKHTIDLFNKMSNEEIDTFLAGWVYKAGKAKVEKVSLEAEDEK